MSNTLDEKLKTDFEWFVSYWVGKSLHDSKIGKIGLRWKLTKAWNSRLAHAGIPGIIREKLGEEDATKLFQDISDDIIKDATRLARATEDFLSFGKPTLHDSNIERRNNDDSNPQYSISRYLSSKNVTSDIADTVVIADIIRTLQNNNIKYELSNYENKLFISAKGYGTIFGNRLPLRIESIFGNFDPMKCQTDEFLDLVDEINEELTVGSIQYEHIPDPQLNATEISSASHIISDLASLQASGKIASFVETIIYYNSTINTTIQGNALIDLLRKREEDKQTILERLNMFTFDELAGQPEVLTDGSSAPESQILTWSLPSIDLLDDTPSGSIKKSGVVPLKSILKSDAFTKTDQPLSIALGVNENNTPVTVGLQMLGAVLAAGQTGSGKSTFTESTLLLSLLYKYTPDELKLVLIDPKVVQFAQYQSIPHLLRPIITEPSTSREAFDWLLGEVKRRIDAPDAQHPYIVIVIDEVSDLMAVDKQYYEMAFTTIAESAKKTGIHLYMGTSRPSTDIYTEKLRQAIDGRIVFTTASQIDSITTLGEPGAEQLAGYGAMIFKPYDGSGIVKIQSPYASEEEVVRVADFWRNQGDSRH